MKILYKTSLIIILKRLLISLGILFFIRLGNYLPVPGINHIDLAIYIQTNQVAQNLISTFTDEENLVIGLFTLNIFPYINASIIVQFIVAFSPTLSQLQKEGDLNARRSINRLTKSITLVWAIIQSLGLGLYLKQILFNWNFSLLCEIILWLTTGAMIVLWLSDLITDYGLGNGPSLLIYVNILSSFPNFYKSILTQTSDTFPIFLYFVILFLVILSLFGVVLLQDGFRIIPLISSKQLNSNYQNRNSRFSNSYIPLKLNQAGVMPIILTTTILVIPKYINKLEIFPKYNIVNLGFFSGIIYWVSYFLLIMAFSLFYSSIVLNPKDIAQQLQKMAVTIPGVRPGIQTAFYLKQIMKRLILIGSFCLAILTTLPNLIQVTLGISIVSGLSTTSLLIIAGVLVDITKEIDDIIYSNIYTKIQSNYK